MAARRPDPLVRTPSEIQAPWQPEILDRTAADDEQRYRELIAQECVVVHDQIRAQLQDLVRSRHPTRRLEADDVDRLVRAELGTLPPERYGRWIHYPWDRRLVHTLPPEAFAALRSDRNRALILPEQQRRLRQQCIGIIGMSAGFACATTMVLEGVGGHFRLADFDRMELSNLNRIRTGIHGLGINKAVLAARELVQIDPFLKVEVFQEGITDATIDAFFSGDGLDLDLLVEECDDLYIKIRAREIAKERRIPVVMEMSFRGTVDIERFDLEPGRDVMHGLLGDVRAADLRGLSTEEKVPYVMSILGIDDVPPEFAGSLMEIEQTVSTWPQLGSWVAAGGALATAAARRVLLGGDAPSGRHRPDGTPAPLPTPISPTVETVPEAKRARRHLALPPPGRGLEPTREEAEFLVHYAALAPSGGNAQPWRFVVQGRDVHCHVDDSRATSHLDFQRRGSHVAIGAAVENLVHAARALGLDTSVRPFPNEGDDPRWVATVRIMARVDPLRTSFFEHLPRRVTNRRRGAPAPLAAADLDALREAAAGAEICVVQERSVMHELAELLGEGDRIRLLSKTMHPELMREIRWTPDEVRNTRDGLDLASLELTPTDATGLRMLTAKTAEFLRRIDGGRNLRRMARDAIAGSSALLLLTRAGGGPNAYFEGGRCLQRLWTQATRLGISVQPWSALCYLFPRLASGEGLEPNEAASLRELHTRWRHLLPRTEPSVEVLFMRLSKAPEASAISLRLPVTTVLDFQDPSR